MTASQPDCSLYLCPADKDYRTEDSSELVSFLRQIGLISKAIEDRDDSFLTGDQYLSQIAYMGCSPAITFEASDNDDRFCHVRLHLYDSARLIYSQIQSRTPVCPHCRKPMDDWQQQLTSQVNRQQMSCTYCNETTAIEDLNWRKMAGYAHLFIEITDVYPKEALPQQSLLDRLAAHSGTSWQYFYSCQ